MMPMLISSCQGGPTRTEVAEAGVGAVKHCSLFYLLKNVQRQRRPETRQDIKDAGATCWGGGVSIDCSHMLHLKRLGEAEDYPGLGSLKIWKPFGLLYSGKIDFDLKLVGNDDFEVCSL